NGPDTFDRPTGVAIAPNGDIFVSDGHLPNAHNNGRILKFTKDGKFIKSWGKKGSAPGDFDEPHDIFIGGSQNRLYVADRRNQRNYVKVTQWAMAAQRGLLHATVSASSSRSEDPRLISTSPEPSSSKLKR